MNDAELKIAGYMDEQFRVYRQSGLGLSATIITLSVLIIKEVLDALTIIRPETFANTRFLVYAVLIFAFASILTGFFIQFFHFLGYMHHAKRFYPEKNIDAVRWKDQKWKIGNKYFSYGDKSVFYSSGFLLLSFILGVTLHMVLRHS